MRFPIEIAVHLISTLAPKEAAQESNSTHPWLDTFRPINQRIELLRDNLTLQDKLGFVEGAAALENHGVGAAINPCIGKESNISIPEVLFMLTNRSDQNFEATVSCASSAGTDNKGDPQPVHGGWTSWCLERSRQRNDLSRSHRYRIKLGSEIDVRLCQSYCARA